MKGNLRVKKNNQFRQALTDAEKWLDLEMICGLTVYSGMCGYSWSAVGTNKGIEPIAWLLEKGGLDYLIEYTPNMDVYEFYIKPKDSTESFYYVREKSNKRGREFLTVAEFVSGHCAIELGDIEENLDLLDPNRLLQNEEIQASLKSRPLLYDAIELLAKI